MSTYAKNEPLSFYQSNYDAAQAGMAHDSGSYNELSYNAPAGWVAAFTAAGFEGESTLYEELGVNFNHIKVKTMTVLNPLRSIDAHIMDDTDLFGPLIFGVLFGFILLLSGKVHFGYVYGCALMGCVSLWTILSLMAPATASFSRIASVLGYCLLPLVSVSAFGLVMNMDGIVGYGLTAAAVLWSTNSASAIFVSVLNMANMRVLVAYPVALFYSIFAILSLFSEAVVLKS
ncbi:SNARE yip1 [Taphrina deformans PYCC 5710]|uniref:Protein YIP n=1 Tax=Taphrina deformans (strain PYCC 5710 / ATCC 11124 / CBS 356.35 / IMI 108563 / JCM 9778 / NBRC 8474) TaxID=1097556 RepID=R4X6D1_TAPDE|nr:SNARE yip1 [Taphrina deformans PYCC 5710]|eukprot:CCG80585.1 SNARE yip1 [Taphrina deformans PYCC 5710]